LIFIERVIVRKNKNATLRKPEILESYYQVLVREGIEGASIGKIARHLDIHPSLIIHYFKNKENMKLELINLLIEKYKSPDMINLDHIKNSEERFHTLMDTLFSYDWSRTVDPGIHFAFYYLSFRNKEIKNSFKQMFVWLRNYIQDQLAWFNAQGIIRITDEKKAADLIVTLMEGLEFHSHFLSEDQPFEVFSQISKHYIINLLKTNKV
jgi:AcrR family transcriptional regulator